MPTEDQIDKLREQLDELDEQLDRFLAVVRDHSIGPSTEHVVNAAAAVASLARAKAWILGAIAGVVDE